jgi:acyl dehydratase
MALHYFEDFRPGETVALGSRVITEAEIIAFARDFDPQIFHLDAEAAQQSSFGGLVASGWHSCVIFMRLFVDGFLNQSSALAGYGVDAVRWLRPVRPGDRLSAAVTVLEATPSRGKPDRGFVKHGCTLTNQQGEVVLTMETLALFGRRDVAAADADGPTVNLRG